MVTCIGMAMLPAPASSKDPVAEATPAPGAALERPIEQAPAFLNLPPGAVQPDGWLKRSLQAWAAGVTGHLHEYRREGEWRFWNAFDNRSYKNGFSCRDKWWPLEEQPYWADGLFQLAFILDDARLKGIARELADRCLAGQTAEGYMGGWPEQPYSNEGDL